MEIDIPKTPLQMQECSLNNASGIVSPLKMLGLG